MAHLVLDNTLTLKIFEVVAEARSITLKELLQGLSPKGEDKTEFRGELYERLKGLMDDGLLEEEKAPIEDYSIYYVTADGLLAYHKLSRAGLLENDEPTTKPID